MAETFVRTTPVYEAMKYDGTNAQAIVDWVAARYPTYDWQVRIDADGQMEWLPYNDWVKFPVGNYLTGSDHPMANTLGMVEGSTFSTLFEPTV